MGYAATIRAQEAARKREERDAQRRKRELERQAKQQAKLSEMEQARLEVERYEAGLEVLLSVHKERGDEWDWRGVAAALPPPPPERHSHHELRATQTNALMSAEQRPASTSLVEQARLQDEQEFQRATQAHAKQLAEWLELRDLARRILAGEHKALTDALIEVNPFAEISELGSTLHFTVHTAKLVECVVKVNGKQAIPTEVKSLTSVGKVSVRPMPKRRFHEIYQDYVCACVLRIAREVFALLPVDTVLVTAVVDSVDPRTGQPVEAPVVSVALARNRVVGLDFAQLDPSNAIDSFQHRGDVKASRKSEAFEQIAPLTPADIPQSVTNERSFEELLATVHGERQQFKTEIASLTDNTSAAAQSLIIPP